MPATSRALALIALVVISGPAQALACPDCSTSRIVRASVFDGSFATHLFLIALPLAVLAVICALLYRIGRRAAPAAPRTVSHSQELPS
jgi:hypothetical protein